MALFDTNPQNTESVKLGAQRIRDLKAALNATLGLIFSDSVIPTWVANIIPGASLANASVTATQLAAGAVTAPKLAAGAVTAAAVTPDAYAYAAATFAANTYTVTLAPAPAALVPGLELSFLALSANAGATTLAANGLTASLIYFGPGSPTAGSPIASLTSSAGVATVTTAAAHGLTTGNMVTVKGAADVNYNVTATITVTSGTQFTYAVANSPASPATVAAAPAIKKAQYQDLAPGDITANQAVTVIFDGTNFQMSGPTANLVDTNAAAYAGIARAWVIFDGTTSYKDHVGVTAPSFIFNSTGRTLTTSVNVALLNGTPVGVDSTGGLPTGLAAYTLYYLRNLSGNGVSGNSFALYATLADSLADTNRLGTTNGTPTHYLLYTNVKASFNIKGVLPCLSQRDGGNYFYSYEIYFQTPPASANFTTVASGKPSDLSAYLLSVYVDAYDLGLNTKKRIQGVYFSGANQYAASLKEASAVFFWN